MSSNRARLAAVFLICFVLGFIGGRVAAAGPENLMISRDTDGNGLAESYQLINHQVTVWEDRQMIWESPTEWKIEQIIVADADNDSTEELLMVLWKYGSFGEMRPFWHEREDSSDSCHLFLYRLQAGRMRAVWCSSALEPAIEEIRVINERSQPLSLEVRESSRFPYPAPHTTWQWQDWGFTRTGKQGDVLFASFLVLSAQTQKWDE